MTTTITVNERVAARLTEQARQAGQPLDAYLSTVLEALFAGDVRWEGRRPVLPVPPNAAPVTVEQIDALLEGGDASGRAR